MKTNKEERIYVTAKNNPEQVTDPVPTNRSKIVDAKPTSPSPNKPKH